MKQAPENKQANTACSSDAAAPPIRLLLAEDNPTSRLVAINVLKKNRYAVDTAVNGEEVLKLLTAAAYDFILMDVEMPVMDGLATTRNIRSWAEQPPADAPDRAAHCRAMASIPIAALTGHAFEAEHAECFAAGMNAILLKPFRALQVEQLLRQWLPPDAFTDMPAPGETPPPAAEQPQIFNRERMMTQLMDDGQLVEKIREAYLFDQPRQLKRLRQALEQQQPELISRLTHTMKGAAANCCADQMLQTLTQMDLAARRQDFTAVQALLPELEHQLVLFAKKEEDRRQNAE